ncbi:MAG: hypothetical protein JRJ70_14435, partial [Deltaproteobacteria bacterium]|nr:hypothetical protein [Deltaproteobacteria bacterium]
MCPKDGSRLISLDPGSRSPQILSSAGTTVGSQPQTIPPIGQTSAGVTLAGPTTMAPGGQEQVTPRMGQTSAGTVVGGQPGTIPPMGQTSAGITVAGPTTMAPGGQEQTVPRMGQSSTKATTSPLTGSQAPLQGTPQRPYYAGAAKGQRDLDPPASPTGQTSAGVTVAGPTAISSQSQLRAGAAGAIPSPGSLPGATGTLNLNQQTQYC